MVGLIIFGHRTSTKVQRRGEFTCPRCGPNRTFEHKIVKRWFTLYFIPVIPMGTVGQYVQCLTCAMMWGPEALALALPPARVVK